MGQITKKYRQIKIDQSGRLVRFLYCDKSDTIYRRRQRMLKLDGDNLLEYYELEITKSGIITGFFFYFICSSQLFNCIFAIFISLADKFLC